MDRDELKVEYADWLENKVTKAFIKAIEAEGYLQRNMAAMGECRKDSFTLSGEAYIKAMMIADTCDFIKSLEFDDIFPLEDKIDESNKTSRASSPS